MRRSAPLVVLARVGAVLALAAALVVAVVGFSPAGTSGGGSYAPLPGGLKAPGSSQVGYVPAGLTVSRSFSVQSATIADYTFIGPAAAKLTPRTDQGLRAALSTGLIALANVRCWDEHAWNPSSDHPRGKGCDLFQDYRSSPGVAVGWRLANWMVANQAALGINYVIWQNQIWTSGRPASWVPYQSSIYGCPNPANITGCHMDHIHVSFY
jgi:hypothetical protein